MAEENPYVAPSSAAESNAITDPPPRLLSGILLFVGTCFLLLLNGQHFTNRLVFLGLVAVSAFLWYRFRSRARAHDPNAGRFALLIHLILFLAFAVTLPDAYSRQSNFNNAINRLKPQSRTLTPENPTTSQHTSRLVVTVMVSNGSSCQRNSSPNSLPAASRGV